MLFPLPSRPDPPPRVVVTGAGIVTALGLDWDANVTAFRRGDTAFRPVTLFDVSRQRVRNAAEVDLPAEFPATRLTPSQKKRLERASRLLLLAAVPAWQQAGWEPSENLPIVLGTTSGGMGVGEEYFRVATGKPRQRHRQPTRALHYQPQGQALDMANALGLHGPITIIANACASGANAIGHAWDLIRSGQANRVLTGGYDALSQLVFAGFDSLQALSPTQCRPFDARRDGLGLGEGAAMLCLETLAAAQHRDAEILGEICGYGAATDVHHLTQPHPQGEAAWQSMAAACRSAGLAPERIDYINAHGTGTPLNDAAEAQAIHRLLGARAPSVPVSSTKSSIGHLLGAAGAVEAVVCLMSLRGQWLPPTSTLREPDPACVFPVVCEPTDANVEYALSNSFGFGGANATLILRRWP